MEKWEDIEKKLNSLVYDEVEGIITKLRDGTYIEDEEKTGILINTLEKASKFFEEQGYITIGQHRYVFTIFRFLSMHSGENKDVSVLSDQVYKVFMGLPIKNN
ncbi:MAG: hypothetical protein N2749_06910 [Clostridia bacterium]|nr:hypothetical protein [Clostridia bacterium]